MSQQRNEISNAWFNIGSIAIGFSVVAVIGILAFSTLYQGREAEFEFSLNDTIKVKFIIHPR